MTKNLFRIEPTQAGGAPCFAAAIYRLIDDQMTVTVSTDANRRGPTPVKFFFDQRRGKRKRLFFLFRINKNTGESSTISKDRECNCEPAKRSRNYFSFS
jgi:hypothetical protein